ncbi:MAG TPA: EAL domain-containing protein [Burkholderiales bacterium]|jgi:EAL domain-containing protein (putative c-di-GMP-specific phosphodiesterase class I)
MPTVQETVLGNSSLQEIEEISAAPLALDDIWKGIEADQFLPYFQPKVSLRGMELAGVEALMRWQHPERGLLSAGAFLPLIADNFLFDELTAIMLEKSIAQSRRWQSDRVNVPVSVNLSPDLLRDAGIAERIEAKALRHGLPAHRLIIEVPEAAIAHDIAESLDNLVRLRVKGFGLAIDDFGTGHCDRNQLERIPASEMKIDRMMLAGAAQRPALKALLHQAIELARDLNLNSVAEGVESQEEWDLVNELGCDMAQGYFIARPMAGDDLVTWLHAWTSDPFV